MFYALERLWKDCPIIPLPELVAAGADVSGPAGPVGRLGERGYGGTDGNVR